MYEYGHNLSWQVVRADRSYLFHKLLTCQIDFVCSQRITSQLQKSLHVLRDGMEDIRIVFSCQ